MALLYGPFKYDFLRFLTKYYQNCLIYELHTDKTNMDFKKKSINFLVYSYNKWITLICSVDFFYLYIYIHILEIEQTRSLNKEHCMFKIRQYL